MGVQWFVEENGRLPSWERLCSLAALAGVRVEEFEMFISFDSSLTEASGVFNRSDDGRRLATKWLEREYGALWASATPEPTVLLLVEEDYGDTACSWWSRFIGWLRGR